MLPTTKKIDGFNPEDLQELQDAMNGILPQNFVGEITTEPANAFSNFISKRNNQRF